MTPEERAHAWVEGAYLCEHGERNEFRHNYECEVCVASLLVGAALRERDARWLGALDEQNNSCAETLDHIYRNAVAPDDQYPFDHKCESCAPLRALLEEAGRNG